MLDDLQSDIFAPDHKKVSEFLSSPLLSPRSFLETSAALRNAHGKKEERRRRQMKNRQKSGTKTLSLLLLKEKGTSIKEECAIGEGRMAKQDFLSHFHLM